MDCFFGVRVDGVGVLVSRGGDGGVCGAGSGGAGGAADESCGDGEWKAGWGGFCRIDAYASAGRRAGGIRSGMI